jgi:hypothetical protein
MVGGLIPARMIANLLAAEGAAEPVLQRLDPPRRAAVVMALLALTLVGVFLVAAVMIGAHWVRRLARREHGRTKHVARAENQRLRDALRPILPQTKSGETIVADRTRDDTIADRP